MTGPEAKTHLFNRKPVVHNGITYNRITAIIYRCDDNNNLIVSAELLDKNKHSVIIARLKDVKATDDNQDQATANVP